MTIGIYLLKFSSTDKVYIGQSSNIEHRFLTHLSKLRNNKASKILQEAYNQYGPPILEILLECSTADLDSNEIEAIEIFSSNILGFNSTKGGAYHSLVGEKHPTAKCTDSQYLSIIQYLLNPALSLKEIAEITGVSYNIISHISRLESHGYIADKYPEEFKKLKEYNSLYIRRPVAVHEIVSPEGAIYSVSNVSTFAKEHNLTQSRLSLLFNGKTKTHKGWTLPKH